MSDCLFCRIGREEVDAVVIHDDDEVMAFLDFTGGDVAHAHAHVVPLHEKTDITSNERLLLT